MGSVFLGVQFSLLQDEICTEQQRAGPPQGSVGREEEKLLHAERERENAVSLIFTE